MSDPIRQELAEELHALSFGDAVACDYHARPKHLSTEEPILVEAIRLVDHPQLQLGEWPDGWVADAARCSECAVESIEEPTKGVEEAVVELPITTTNNVVSVETPGSDAVSVLAYSPATEGTHPMVLSQRLMDAAPPGDMVFSRWNRVQALLEDGPADPSREHIEHLSSAPQRYHRRCETDSTRPPTALGFPPLLGTYRDGPLN